MTLTPARHFTRFAVPLALLTLAALGARSADALTWDIVANDGSITGGAGTWSAADDNWTADGGASNTGWISNAEALFSDGSGVVTVDAAGVSVDEINVSTAGYEIAGPGTITLAVNSGNSTINADTLISADVDLAGVTHFFSPAGNRLLEISGDLSGTGTARTGGGGTLRLSGDNSAFNGSWLMIFNTWQLASPTALGDGSESVSWHGAGNAFKMEAFGSARSYSNDINIINASNDFDFIGSNDLAFTGTVTLNASPTFNTLNTGLTTLGQIVDGSATNVTKTGDQVLVFAGDNTYTGTTSVNEGTLLVNGTTSGQGDFTVGGAGQSATLGGTGTIGLVDGASVTAQTDGTIAPGQSIGTLSVDGDVVFGDGSSFDVEINAAGLSDLLAIDGNLDLSSLADTLNITGVATGDSSYTLATYTGTLTGQFDTVTGLPAGYTVRYGSGLNDAITLFIPEPASASLILAAGMAMVRRRRE